MNHIKYIAVAVFALLAVSCDEFPPVNYDDPQPYKVYGDADFADSRLVTIAELKEMYRTSPVDKARTMDIRQMPGPYPR